MSSDGPWRLHVPFMSAPGMTFSEEVSKTVAGCTILIQQDTNPYSRLVISELATIDEARDKFSALQRAMLAASLMVGCGIRVKDNLKVFNHVAQLPSEANQPFVCPQERSLARLVLSAGEPELQVQRVLPQVLEGIEVGMSPSFAVQAMRDQHVSLACELYIDSFFERSIPTQFIGLIGVLEVLKDQDAVSSEAMQLIKSWLKQVGQLENDEAESFRGQLKHMKQLSISRGIGCLVARHLGQDQAREARNLYGVRSNLVHRGERPTNLEDHLRRAQHIVRELLIKILIAGSR